jgi:DUF2075 family protein
MLIYHEDKKKFLSDVHANQIDDVLHARYVEKVGHSVSKSELLSWKNSLQYMGSVLSDPHIPMEAGIAIEFQLPQSSKRIDFIIAGLDDQDRSTAIIVELKQWTEVEKTPKDAIVRTLLGGKIREVPHPSYQAWSYAAMMEDFNEAIGEHNIKLRPCAFLHNCVDADALKDSFYSAHTDKALVFAKHDTTSLTNFIRQYIRKGDQGKLLYALEHGRIRPSKSFADHLAGLMKGKQEFVLIDDQKVVYESIRAASRRSETDGKQVVIVEGGPGTGKTVVAINNLVDGINAGRNALYVTRNAAPREVYQAKLNGHFTKTRIANLFKGSGSFVDTPADTFDTIIVDEAHRLNEKSGMFQNKGESQMMEIVRAARCSVFFIDEDQRVTLKDVGRIGSIESWAFQLGATVERLKLQSQFRCNGADGYPAWLSNTLQIRETANTSLAGVPYEFRVVDSPSELRELIYQRNIAANRARIVAGYCWDWKSRTDSDAYDIVFDEHDFRMRWNLDQHGMLWIMQPNSLSEVGCIHTCQGLELDYVGVIIGKDLLVRNGVVEVHPEHRSRMDSSIKGYKKLSKLPGGPERIAAVIKNTYRTLMTRGMKGCYVWAEDAETNAYLRAAMAP